MPVSDLTLAKQMTYALLENGNADATGTSLLTSMFTISEIVQALDQSQSRFLKDTGMIVTTAFIPSAPGVNRYDLPNDNCIAIRRMSFQTPVSGTGFGYPGFGGGPYGGSRTYQASSLSRADTWEQDHGIVNWDTTPGTPISWWETTIPDLGVGIAPAPIASGQFNLLYVALAATLTGGGVNLGIPDDWTPYIAWCALGALLGQDGPAYDPLRSAYCYRRYDEGVELARMVLRG